jgi:REP element-mobilizing transposase RayT
MKRFKDASLRAQWWDYSRAASYFITICTKDRVPYFGNVVHGQMVLSELGEVAKIELLKTVEMRPQMNLCLEEFIVMPDHVHVLITIGLNHENINLTGNVKNEFKPQSNNLASIIRGFKSAVTQYSRVYRLNFEWQSRYHDVIVRNSSQFERIKQYIIDNPKKYRSGKDRRFFEKNIFR